MTRTIVWASLLVVLATVVPAGAETVNFVVGRPIAYEFGMGDSYVLPLHDPADIATARQLIQTHGFLVVVASVAKGSDNVNRDVVAPGEPLWSWHVAEFVAFATAVIELCDGTPTFTEGDAQAWGEGELHDICYWEYTVVDELAPVSVDASTWGRIKALYQ